MHPFWAPAQQLLGHPSPARYSALARRIVIPFNRSLGRHDEYTGVRRATHSIFLIESLERLMPQRPPAALLNRKSRILNVCTYQVYVICLFFLKKVFLRV